MNDSMNRVVCLDGMRGLAALWVLIGHCMLLTGFLAPVLSKPDLGVDLFILLSGFLMVFQYRLRKDRENWDEPGTWLAFWVRRFFRISPLYYCLLIVALSCGAWLHADRVLIDTFFGREPQLAGRYLDGSLTNILMHLSYAFGFVPDYAYRTPLPDWSLGLEMQFYAAFPFIVLLARRVGWLAAASGVACLGIAVVLVLYALDVDFPMPAFLPLKLHLFLAGMMIAADHDGNRRRLIKQLALAMLFAAIPFGSEPDLLHFLIREALVIGFFALVHWRSLAIVDRLSRLLGSKPFYWLGELSFGTYLIHLMVLHPVAAWAIRRFGMDIAASSRFVIVFLIVAVISYALAFVGYTLIERPGQTLGRNILTRAGRRRGAVQTPAEEIAAP